jgi:multiple sugar transport system permease protein
MGKKKNGLKKYDNVGYLFVLPFVIVFCIFSVYPVLRTLYFSFTNAKIAGVGVTSWVWFDNYKRVLTDKFFWRALWNTVRIWGVNIVLQLGLAFLLTIVFSDIKYKIKGLGVFRVIYYLPNLIAATSVAFLFQTLLDWRYGTFNQIIASIYRLFGASYNPIDWLGSSATAGVTIAVISSWMWFGNSFIMLMAGVQGISKDYFEAAAIDGAGRWIVFGKITLPLLRPMLLYVAITSLIGGLQMFDLPYLMSNPAGASYNSVYTVVMYLYKFGFTTGTTQTGYASAIAYVLFLIILAVSVIQLKVFNGDEEKAASRRAKKRAAKSK